MTTPTPPADWENLAFDTINGLRDAMPQVTDLAVQAAQGYSFANLIVGAMALSIALIAAFIQWSRHKSAIAVLNEGIEKNNRYDNSEQYAWFFFTYFGFWLVPVIFFIIAMVRLLDYQLWLGIFAPQLFLIIKIMGW